MARRYAKGSKSKAIDDRSGFKVDYKDLRTEWNGLRVHKREWEAKHPQLTRRPVSDATALYQPRPDSDPDNALVKVRSSAHLSVDIGTVTFATSLALTGQGMTVSVGTVGVDIGQTVFATGQGMTASQGTVVPVAGTSATGQGMTVSLGNPAISLGEPATGQGLTVSIGTVGITTDSPSWGSDKWGEGAWSE